MYSRVEESKAKLVPKCVGECGWPAVVVAGTVDADDVDVDVDSVSIVSQAKNPSRPSISRRLTKLGEAECATRIGFH